MLQKQLGNIQVEKLCIIILFKADFNMNNKWIGRTIMYKAKQLKILAPEQYGSQKEKAANIQSLNKHLFYDTVQFRRQLVALCSNDAKSCYDRIILLIAALTMCRLGAQKSGAKA